VLENNNIKRDKGQETRDKGQETRGKIKSKFKIQKFKSKVKI
jgi:hypothetical protein